MLTSWCVSLAYRKPHTGWQHRAALNGGVSLSAPVRTTTRRISGIRVAGLLVDIGPVDATAWLSVHGATYELCQIYGNEPWHFERRAEASAQGCLSMYADPTHDPRMRR
jgi:D-alanyl-D-alanine carboxypeptidase